MRCHHRHMPTNVHTNNNTKLSCSNLINSPRLSLLIHGFVAVLSVVVVISLVINAANFGKDHRTISSRMTVTNQQLLVIGTSPTYNAKIPATIPLWPDPAKIPGEHRLVAAGEKNAFGDEIINCKRRQASATTSTSTNTPQHVVEATDDNRCLDRSATNVSIPELIPYLVPHSDSAILIAPGGSYTYLALDKEGTDIAVWLNRLGISAFVLKYRVPARDWLEFGAAPLMDAQRAMGLVRQMASSSSSSGSSTPPRLPNLNTSKIGFIGFSAGGHLAGHLNVAWKQRSYAHVDAVDSLSCRPDVTMMLYPWRSVRQPPVNEPISGASASNVTHQTPPTLLVQAEDDWVHVENSIYYYLALEQAGAGASELHVYPQGGHGFGRCTFPGSVWYDICTWTDRAEAFLKTLGVLSANTTNDATSYLQ